MSDRYRVLGERVLAGRPADLDLLIEDVAANPLRALRFLRWAREHGVLPGEALSEALDRAVVGTRDARIASAYLDVVGHPGSRETVLGIAVTPFGTPEGPYAINARAARALGGLSDLDSDDVERRWIGFLEVSGLYVPDPLPESLVTWFVGTGWRPSASAPRCPSCKERPPVEVLERPNPGFCQTGSRHCVAICVGCRVLVSWRTP